MVKKHMYTENGEDCKIGSLFIQKSQFLLLVVVVQFRQAYLINQTGYRGETLHITFFVNILVNNKNLPEAIHYDRDH